MELVSESDEQTRAPDEATVKTRCLVRFATPMRERAAMDRGWLIRSHCVEQRTQHNSNFISYIIV